MLLFFQALDKHSVPETLWPPLLVPRRAAQFNGFCYDLNLNNHQCL
jgi:hypothetical protein